MMTTDIQSLFYESFDESVIRLKLVGLAQIPEARRGSMPGFLGEGYHFQSFDLPAKPLDLVLNIAKSTFLQRGVSALERWQRAMATVQLLPNIPLIPPVRMVKVLMAVELQDRVHLGLVMPKGVPLDLQQQKLAPDLVSRLKAGLAASGLTLGDVPQIKAVMGVPFIFDWSDLKSKPEPEDLFFRRRPSL